MNATMMARQSGERHTGNIVEIAKLEETGYDRRLFESTSLQLPGVANTVLRDVLKSWDTTLTPALPVLLVPHASAVARSCELHVEMDRLIGQTLAWISPILGQVLLEGETEDESKEADSSGSETAVEAIHEVKKMLGLPLRDVLTAAGVAHRTFYSWRGSKVSPRLSSQGRLWALVQASADLREIMGEELPRWVAADPDRRQSLLAGDFDSLMAEVLERKAQRGEYREYGHTSEALDHIGAAGPEYPDFPETQARRLTGKVRKVKPGVRVRGAAHPR
ncbi:hypothetical protein ACSMX9_12080 [Streptomyces sp. LE64]|uniref:hypothetical protein n=1 Tax=Streptomyces sp. LE64 TaxID=3448653 RepID=UPI004041364F